MKLLYLILIGILGLALYMAVIGFRDIMRYREIRQM
jgi:hypothetical protein